MNIWAELREAMTKKKPLLKKDDTSPSITCPKCSYTSYHPKDIEFEFCAHCDEFHDGCKRGYGGVKIPKGGTKNERY